MAPAKKAAAAKASAPAPADMPEICAEHWPDGWPNEEYSSIACEHGSWTHPNFVPPELAPEQPVDQSDGEDVDQDAVQF